jgi:2-C-methyl-D-erythritol 4-phosphate cytidylyltransferase/2-C-methyl-D-erythritol 2,4-cyclodiphosphate synthase
VEGVGLVSSLLLIVAAGSGTRLGRDAPKALVGLAGRPLLSWTLDAFAPGAFSRVVVAAPRDRLEDFARLVGGRGRVVAGGETRSASVRLGVAALAPEEADVVAIHDAARPLVSDAEIRAVLEAAGRTGAAAAATAAVDTIKRVSGNSVETLDRREIFAAATPQAFRWPVLEKALALGDATDEAALCERLGVPVALVPVSRLSFKITSPADLELAEAILSARSEAKMKTRAPRVGIGFDAHPFVTGRPLRLGGIAIPHAAGLEGHSDGDALLHALTDAVLGAAGLGSIGDHFPPSDPAWKDADSAVFVERARSLAADRGWSIGNVDAVVIAEAPRIAPHAAAMRERVAALLRTEAGSVSVRGTSTNGLGFTGRKDGLAAAVIVLLVPGEGEGEGEGDGTSG